MIILKLCIFHYYQISSKTFANKNCKFNLKQTEYLLYFRLYFCNVIKRNWLKLFIFILLYKFTFMIKSLLWNAPEQNIKVHKLVKRRQ